MKQFLKKLTELGYHQNDTDEEKANKSSLVVLSMPFALAGIIWGILYFVNGLLLPASIPFSYGILSLLSFVLFSITKKYKLFRNSQLFLILILPFLLQLSLGGFIPSSAVIIWALIAPVGALVFFKAAQSIGWFIAYIGLVIVAFLINDYASSYFNWELSETFINVVFLLNIIAVSTLIFLVQYYYVGKQTELKEAIEEKNSALEVQTDKLKELDETKSRFFANISHEFRTPLTLILGLVNKQLTNQSSETNIQDNKTIKRNAQRLLQLINQLLDLSKLESGELKLQVEKSNIIEFTRKILLFFESLAQNKQLNIEFNGVDMTERNNHNPIELFFDHDKIEKCITNLISNAIKFAHSKTEINVDVFADTKFVHITVKNSGDVIEKEKLGHLFDRFYQVDTGSTREYEGTGIGLALVKELVELHHGSVNVRSNSKEIIFTILLPLESSIYLEADKKIIDKPLENELSTIQETISTLKSTEISDNNSNGVLDKNKSDQLEILIVEDNPDLRNYIHDILSKEYKVLQAKDGLEGLELAETHIPDLIVSDVMMPNMDGYSLCKRLKTSDKTNHIPVILLTAKASHQNKLEGLETGADDYLIKPFDELELMIRIKNLIKIREQLQKKYQKSSWHNQDEINISSVQQKFIDGIREIIENNLDNSQFSVEDLGSEIAMSRSQVHRKLKAITDQSATQFIRNYRLHRAAELIKLNSGNITEIAYQVGFSSQTYFSSSFQELFGVSPSSYKVDI